MSFLLRRFKTKTLRQELESRNCSCDTSSNISTSLLFGGYTKKNAIGLSAFFAATNLISNSIALMPISENQLNDNKRTVVENSNITPLFYNMFLTKFNVLKKIVEDVILKGNAYLYITRDEEGHPKSLTYLRPSQVAIQYNELTQDLYYLVTSSNKVSKKKILDKDMCHFVMHSNDGVNGLSILSYATRTIDSANATEQSAKQFFDSGCSINGIVRLKNPIVSDKQRNEIRNNWAQIHGGDNCSGVCVLSGVEDFTPITSDPNKSQMLETRRFNITEVARWFNINPILLGDLSHTSYNDIEAANIEFVQHTLLPWIEMIQNELTRKLIVNKKRYIDLDENVLLKSNKTNMANYCKTLVTGGIMTANEARAQLGLNPMDGADRLIVAYSKINDNTINTNGKDNDKEENGQQ